jgi:hypothetical protein
VRQQARLMLHDFDAAIAALPTLLSRAEPDAIGALGEWLQQVLQVPEAPTPDEEASLQQMLEVFDSAIKAQAKALPLAASASRPASQAGPQAKPAKNITSA